MPIRKPFCVIGILILIAGITALSSTVHADDIVAPLKKRPITIDFDDVIDIDKKDTATERSTELRIAVAAMISPKYTYKYYVDLLNLIGDLMDCGVQFIQKKTYSEVNTMLKQHEIDLAFVCSGPYVSGKARFGLEIIAVPLCHGQKVYYSYFIAPRTEHLTSFDELRGKTFAFTDPLSNTGYAVPKYVLAVRKETPESFFKRTFFTFSHDNSIQAVANGLADGAAVDSLIYDFIKAKQPELTEKTVVIEKSPPYGIPPVVVPPDLDAHLKSRLKRMFLSIHENPKGKRLLANLQIDRFVEGNDVDYDTVREMQAYLNKPSK